SARRRGRRSASLPQPRGAHADLATRARAAPPGASSGVAGRDGRGGAGRPPCAPLALRRRGAGAVRGGLAAGRHACEPRTEGAELWGTLAVTSADRTAAVKVTLDDQPRGLAPLMVDSLAPGVHRVQFWSPGAGSWDQIVEVRVRDTSRVVARPIASPATGVLE